MPRGSIQKNKVIHEAEIRTKSEGLRCRGWIGEGGGIGWTNTFW